MTVQIIDDWKIIQELVQFLRNSDIFTIAQRGVTTTTITGTFTAATSHTIAVANVKNIRSIVVGLTTLQYGADYQVDTTFLDTTYKCKITFTAAQTGAYTIIYDAGTDKIWEDYPEEFLTIAAFPRLAVGLAPSTSTDGGLGNINEVNIFFQVNIYDTNKKNVHEYMTVVRQKFMDNWTNFYYLKGPIKARGRGALINSPNGNTKVYMKMQEFVSLFNYEK